MKNTNKSSPEVLERAVIRRRLKLEAPCCEGDSAEGGRGGGSAWLQRALRSDGSGLSSVCRNTVCISFRCRMSMAHFCFGPSAVAP